MEKYCRENFKVSKKIRENIDFLYKVVSQCSGKEQPSFEDWLDIYSRVWYLCEGEVFRATLEVAIYRFDDPRLALKNVFWDYVRSIHSSSDRPICAVYMLFSKDGKIVKIGSSENLLQRMDSYRNDPDFQDKAHGCGQIYYYPCNVKERYFLEDVLRAKVGQIAGLIKAHRTDVFYCSEKA